MNPTPPNKRPSLLGPLLQAVYWVDESLQESLRQNGFERIPRTWSMVMINVANGVQRPIRIASNIGVSRQAIQKTLSDMSKMGLIDVVSDPEDRRATIVNYSPRGKPIQDAASQILSQLEDTLEQRIGQRRLRQLKDALEADWGELTVTELD